ncbi:SDR family oxidoreductase [Amycolatopsis sp. CA-230715]|uniref:SDR family oxidoreductase n=1 Tax=Amycolatopsis sp. CA-230715 TaxID=2745196 RepID=UPI001C0094B0|nr:SDR family oxidoreductase [Amycolatopsis sp. CA-230715]QWF76926.1 putative oxidoreductase [Amycolatopsis sp. CA-230715]
MALDIRLDGSVVLVTGGVRGVGAGIARAFLAAGSSVVVCARHEPREPVAVDGKSADFLPCDVREPEQVSRLVDEVSERHGRLDVLVNNAGGAPFAEAASASPRFHDRVVALNLLAPLTLARYANTVMQGQDSGGAIVNVGSVSGARPSPGTASYGAAKAGLVSLTGSLAVEWAPKVRVNALEVGMVRTEQAELHYGDEAGIAAVGATVPLGRLAEPDEIGACAVFLASPLASYVSGATMAVHGGGEVPAFQRASTAAWKGK